jgi:hypothetical protein
MEDIDNMGDTSLLERPRKNVGIVARSCISEESKRKEKIRIR